MSPQLQFLLDAMENTGADFLVGLLVFFMLADAVALVLFAGLAVRAAWRSRVLTRARAKLAPLRKTHPNCAS